MPEIKFMNNNVDEYHKHQEYIISSSHTVSKPSQAYNADYCEKKEAASLDHSLHRARPITVNECTRHIRQCMKSINK